MSIFSKILGRGNAEPTTKLFFGTDLHGSVLTFKKFLNAPRVYGVNALVMGGDVIGKVAIPVIEEGGGRYRARIMGRTESLDGSDALKDFFDKIGVLGFYAKIMKEDEYRDIASDEDKTESLFYDLALERLREWVSLADEKLKGSGVKLYMMGGNDDYSEMLRVIEGEQTENVVYCENQSVDIDDHHKMISVGYSNLTPWNTPREVSEDEMRKILDEQVAHLTDEEVKNAIFNFHVPPIDSTLDTCPMLDWDSDPPTQISKGGQPVMYGAGSLSVRQSIETHQPLLSLHGHIHESAAVAHIGRTTAVNPGSEYGEGVIRGAIVIMDKNEIKSVQLTSG